MTLLHSRLYNKTIYIRVLLPRRGDGGNYGKHIKPSVLPIYLVGVVWLGYALLFPLKSAASYGICAVLSLVAFIAGKAVFPDKL